MNLKKYVGIMAIIVLAGGGGGGVLLTSCELGGGTDPSTISSDIDYTNYTTDYSVLIKNSSSENLVVFKGTVSQDTLMGGIRAQDSNHGMKKNSVLFSATGDFPLVFITEEDYLKNKNNSTGLENLNKTPFARVYAFYNLTGTNNTIYEVSGKLGGSNKLEISNLTSYNVELRLDGIYGEPLGFASKGMVKQAIYVNDGDYSVFPVFKLYNPIRDIIQTIYPKWSTGLPKSFDLSFLGNSTVGVDVKTYIDSTVNMSTGAAYLIINNQAGATGIQLFKGATPITNSVGIATINPTDTRTYQIDMPGIAGSGAFADHLSISGYQVGTRGNTVSIGDHTLYVDKMYTVTVKFNDGVFSTEFEDSGTVSWEDFRN